MTIVRRHALVQGRVQGVYFRDCTRQEAQRLCLSGWVRNLADGSVEAEVQGEEGDVERLVAWLHRGSPRSRVDRVRSAPCPLVAGENGFEVRY